MTIQEIVNIDVLRDLITATPVSRGHVKLLKALNERYPAPTPTCANFPWRVADFKETWYRRGMQLLDRDGAVVADNWYAWLKGEMDATGGSVSKVWDKHHAAGYLRLMEECQTVFAGAGLGPGLGDVIEVEIGWVVSTKATGAFNKYRPLASEERFNLHNPNDPTDTSWCPPQQPRYEIRHMHSISRMLDIAERLEMQRRMAAARDRRVLVTDVFMDGSGPSVATEKTILELDPDYLRRPLRERRFLVDWSESSSPSAQLLRHWAFAVADFTFKDVRSVEITPRPLTWGPEIKWKRDRSIFKLMELLERFDKKAGYPMAWFFHAVYGNRIGSWAIREVAEGLQKQKIALPPQDAAVVLRWAQNEYSF